MLKINRTFTVAASCGVAVLVATTSAQVGRGGSEWLTARADAQRTSWIRTDPKISVESIRKEVESREKKVRKGGQKKVRKIGKKSE